MSDYNSNEIVDRFLVLGECRGNYRRAAAIIREFPRRRHHPNDNMIRIIARCERRRIRKRQGEFTLIKHPDMRGKRNSR